MSQAVGLDLLPYEYELIDHPQTRWAVDDSFNLFIIPPVSYDDGIHGPEGSVYDQLRLFCLLNERTPSQSEIEGMGLLFIEPKFRRYDIENGYQFR